MDFFYVKRLIGGLAQPAPVVLALMVIALLLLIGNGFIRRKIAWLSLLVALLFFAFVVFPYPVRAVARRLEGKYQPILNAGDPTEKPAAIMVLGSGVEHPGDPGLPALTRLNNSARARLVEGVRLALLFPEAKLITYGFGMGLESCADAMADAAVELGIDPGRIVRVAGDNIRDTEAEAMAAAELARNGTVILVTTAVHMERSMRLFQDNGIRAVPSPCDFVAPQSDRVYADVSRHRWRPNGVHMANNEKTWHELLGLAYLSMRDDEDAAENR